MPRYTSFEVNGTIDPTQNVLDNLNQLATTVGCWITYDSLVGRWSTVINRPGDSEYSFDDTNIIGGVTVSGTGITELYNSVTVQFPNQDLQDYSDYIDYVIPLEDRNLNEPDNNLLINLTTVNNTPQAQYIGISELKQARLDKVIQFKTDFSSIGLKAGTIIDVTQEQYGYENKLFRIVKITEDDADDGNIILEITALEYSDDIYTTTGLIRKERNKKTGVVPKSMNTILTESDAIAQQQKFWKKSVLTPLVWLDVPSASDTMTPFIGKIKYQKIALGYNIELPATGTYKLSYNVYWRQAGISDPNNLDEWGEPTPVYGAFVPIGTLKSSRVEIKVGGNTIMARAQDAFTGTYLDYWAPSQSSQLVEIFFAGYQGEVVEMFCWVGTNWNEYYQNPQYVGTYNFNTPVGFTERAGVAILATLEIASELINPEE